MRPKFQADADLNQKIVAGLRRREPSLDVLSAHNGGILGLPDPQVLSAAAQSGRILISHDRKTMPSHFSRFIANANSPGLIIASQDLEIGATIEDLILIWATMDAEEWVNRLGFLPI